MENDSDMSGFPRYFVAVAFASLAAFISSASGQLYISEFMADNQIGVVDEDGDHSDWIEVYNAGATTATLNGWYLTDEADSNRAKWRFPVTTPVISIAANGRLRVWASDKNRKANSTRLHTNFKLNTSGEHLALVRPDGITIEHGYLPYPQQFQDIAYGLVGTQWQTLVPEGAAGKALVPLSAADMVTGWNGNGAFDDSTWTSGASGFGYDTSGTYGSLIGAGGDLQAAMHNAGTNSPVNTTALIRIPFTVSNATSITSLRLPIKYEDGFICYLNGTLIAQNSAPASPAWDSAATVNRAPGLTATFEVYTPSGAQALLTNGTNVLAIQLLNHIAQDTDSQGTPNGWRALALPTLEGNVTTGVLTPSYLASATPGSQNSAALGALGPAISQTTKSNDVARPTGNASSTPIVIRTKVVPTLNPLNASNPVQLQYQIMYNSVQTVNMQDNGVAPDLVAGDGIYAGQIPTINAGAGRMIRWRIFARDSAATPVSRTDPPYRDTTDNDQYYGTVTLDGISTSQLPIMHWFVQNAAASQTDGGTRCSLFFLGNFYDNVFVGLHGQSSAGFPVQKKSHDFNFNEDNRFLWNPNQDRQKALNLITTWADKSKVRDTLAWETWQNAGHLASHWAQLVRVQQNAVFWGIYDMVENGDDDFIRRAGLDPTASFYKIYDRMISPTASEKKSGFPETDFSDLDLLYQNLEYESGMTYPALPITPNRRLYGYDYVDIPSLVNSLAVNALLNNNDQGHKNFYLYRDNNNTQEWSILPWDQDLALGHTWVSGPNYFDDEIDSQRAIRNGATNKLKALAYDAPEINAMFVRRMRTLMDTFLVSATATDGPLEQRINQLLNLVDPTNDDPATGVDDADEDMRKWGYWLQSGGGNPVTTPSGFTAHSARAMAGRILSSNPNNNTLSYSTYPGMSSGSPQGNNTTFAFMPGRRSYLYSPAAVSGSLSIPAAQPVAPTGLSIEQIDYNPSSGNGEQEFFVIKNTSGQYIDVSGWKITGAVNLTFRGGTVIPPFTTGTDNIGLLHVARNARQFRLRTVAPKGQQYRLVAGGYDGRLTARGATIELRNAAGTLITSNTYTGIPTAAQNALRVTELNYAPLGPSAAETTALPGVTASDFEFIELINTGATALSLANAQFDKGVTFVFPAGYSLAAGARCLVVANLAAFHLRYGTSLDALIAGNYEGNLDNAGERLRILDSVGEEVLDFTYSSSWYPVSGGGYSLVTRSDSPAWNGYGTAAAWALSAPANGTPGAADAGAYSQVYIGWLHDNFTPAEEQIGANVDYNSDPDLDSTTNFGEYAFAKNPRVADGPLGLQQSLVTDGGETYLAVTFKRPKNALDLAWTIEASDSPSGWIPVNLPPYATTNLGNGIEQVTYHDSVPANLGPRFMRVRATKTQ